jgi:DNA polymerase-3 subunit alpha
MGKKIRSEMDAQRDIFVHGAIERGIEPAKAVEVFELMAKFADYGFNKSHAAGYGLLAYQTAWMKANHPAVFLAACMSLAIGNTDKLAALIQEAARSGISILPPDINRSGEDFRVERTEDGVLAIRYALAAVKKVGAAAMASLVAARGERPFADPADFAARVDPRQLNRMQIENLVRAGAFDRLDNNRAKLFAAADIILRRAQALAEERESGQIGLFAGAGEEPEALRIAEQPDWAPLDRLAFEAEAVGFHLTAHPLDAYATALRQLGVIACAQVEARARAGTTRVKLAGSVVALKERVTRTGSRMCWVRISDASGSIEVTLFSEVLGRNRGLLTIGNTLLVTADLRVEAETLRITAQDVVPLDQAASGATAGMRVWLERTEAVPHIRDLLAREGKGKGRVILIPRVEGEQSVEIALPGGYSVSPRLAQAMKVLPGVARVEDV